MKKLLFQLLNKQLNGYHWPWETWTLLLILSTGLVDSIRQKKSFFSYLSLHFSICKMEIEFYKTGVYRWKIVYKILKQHYRTARERKDITPFAACPQTVIMDTIRIDKIIEACIFQITYPKWTIKTYCSPRH